MRVRFGCGHEQDVSETSAERPVCPCGERRVTHVTSRPPRFRGTCTGPLAETVQLEPHAQQLEAR